MQLTTETVAKYKNEAPELLEAVTSGEAEHIMRRDPDSDACVKFDQGWCSIQRDYGAEFLGDACYFFPRVTRVLGAMLVTTAALSCPETARLMLYEDAALEFAPREMSRTPYILKNYLPDGITEEDALAIHQAFMAVVVDAPSAERGLMRVSTIARALEHQPVNAWRDAVALYATMADSRIPVAEPLATDPFHLVHALRGLAMASHSVRPRLIGLIDQLSAALGMTFDVMGTLHIKDDAASRAVVHLSRMRAQQLHLQPVLKRYVLAQLSEGLFPFAGLGQRLSERVTVIGVRFATVKLALGLLPKTPEAAEVISIVQVLSRFLDHLADPTLSLKIYEETGWLREPRLRAVLFE